MSYKINLEVSHFQEIKVIHLLLNSISHLSFDYLVFDEDLTHRLILFVENIQLARKAAMMEPFDFHIHCCRPKTHRLSNIILGEVHLLSILEADKVELKGGSLLGKREDKGFLPGEIFGLRGGFAIAFLVIIGKPAIGLHFLIKVLIELGLPEGYN